MKLSSTSDIPLGLLTELLADLDSVMPTEVDEHQAFFKSVEPPSWVVLFELPRVWYGVLGVAAGTFLGELLKEAAKDTWRNKIAIGRALTKPVTIPLRRVAEGIARLRQGVPQRTTVSVGLPLPDDYFGTRLQLTGRDPDAIALELALFIHHVGAIDTLLAQLSAGGDGPLATVVLEIHADGSVEVQWMGRNSLKAHSRILPPPAV